MVNALKFEFHPDAIIEATEAYEWYALRSQNAAEGFLTRLNEAQSKVIADPDCWPRHLQGTQIYNFNKYPFGLVYVRRNDVIIAIAVAHHKKRPGYWRKRLTRMAQT